MGNGFRDDDDSVQDSLLKAGKSKSLEWQSSRNKKIKKNTKGPDINSRASVMLFLNIVIFSYLSSVV